ncbi:hypothetical protein M501DRAFT_990995 [Patellaria atrata CBS 101060]|uniref:Uncharacterized protein n=1 Tax=Patellaria atrata CBS 101060 TaxID=1346257 RepID=A0A9P4SEH3_9PEZI|nr:hypothetical protein M501DRAFT_990995 [Patellaria atrata CBS 101060]
MQAGGADDAYALLEDSFKEAPLFKAHKVLPHKMHDPYSVFPAAAPLKTLYSLDDDTVSQESFQETVPLASPIVMNGQESGLPPTPPSNSADNIERPGFSPPPFADGLVSSLTKETPTLTTPINQRSPPTPDTTPPRTAENNTNSAPTRPTATTYPSSRADSFKTAREDQGSSDGEEAVQNSRRADTFESNYLDATRQSGLGNFGLGVQFLEPNEDDDDDITPTEKRLASQAGKATHYFDDQKGRARDMDPIPDREWDTNLMRNVTVRRKRRQPSTPPRQMSTSPQVSPPSSRRLRQSSLRVRVDDGVKAPHSDSLEKFAEEIGWPTEVNNILNAHLRNQDTRRNSGMSTTSTVVEAIVVATPPQRRRTLRHTGRNLALRGDTDSPSDGSPVASSNRHSMNSDELRLHRLVHKRSPLPDRRHRSSGESDLTARIGCSGATREEGLVGRLKDNLPQRHASVPIQRSVQGPDVGRTRSLRHTSLSKPNTALSVNKGAYDLYDKPLPAIPISESSPSPHQLSVQKCRQRQNPLPDTNNTSSPKERPVQEDPQHTPNLLDTPKNSIRPDSDVLPPATFPSPKPPKDVQPKLKIESPPKQKKIRPSLSVQDTNTQRRSSDKSTRTSSHSSSRADHAHDEQKLSRRSLDASTFRTEDIRRISTDQSTTDHSLIRYLHGQTPFSQLSTTPDLEVSEATAISIYPHNNHSLLVVQQVARSDNVSKRDTEVVSTPPAVQATQPLLTVEPSTPPVGSAPEINIDSPFMNPRDPPALKIIPPTPAEELDRQLTDATKESRSGPPVRRLSLAQRARRYSDTIIQPLFTRAPLRRANTLKHSRQVPSVGEEKGNLHPFWRPRGFWDDFSDSEDSFDLEDEDRRLPPGGDTSDIDLQRSVRRRLTGTLRPRNGDRGGKGLIKLPRAFSLKRARTDRVHRVIKHGSSTSLGSRGSGPHDHTTTHTRTRIVNVTESKFGSDGTNSSTSAAHSGKNPYVQLRNQTEKRNKVHTIPGLGLQVQYVGIRGVADRIKEKRAEKRRERLRASIGTKFLLHGNEAF